MEINNKEITKEKFDRLLMELYFNSYQTIIIKGFVIHEILSLFYNNKGYHVEYISIDNCNEIYLYKDNEIMIGKFIIEGIRMEELLKLNNIKDYRAGDKLYCHEEYIELRELDDFSKMYYSNLYENSLKN